MLDWMFRPQCAACTAPESPICETCATALVELGPACPRCAEPTGEEAIVCARCRRAPLPLERIVSPWRFGGPLAQAIRRLKFAGASHIARTLAPLWAPLIAAAAGVPPGPAAADEDIPAGVPGPAAIVVPIPLHWRRRWTRGYDHAWLLALHACASAELPRPTPALRRIKHAAAQSTLTAAERAANLDGAFGVVDRYRGVIAGREVILVDDVVTTGATFSAATRVLLAAGARAVTGVALARSSSQ